MCEEWRNIEGYPGYQVSNRGNVRSLVTIGSKNRSIGNAYHPIKPRTDGHGYFIIGLHGKNHRIHRLVAKAFLPNPMNFPVVRHMDDNRTNNVVENLKWGTQRDNIQDAINHGRHIGDTIKAVESKRHQVKAINTETGKNIIFDSIQEASRRLKVQASHISEVISGKLNQTGGWKFCKAEERDRVKHGTEE